MSFRGVHFYNVDSVLLASILERLRVFGDYYFIFRDDDVKLRDVYRKRLKKDGSSWVEFCKTDVPGIVKKLSGNFRWGLPFVAIGNEIPKMEELLICNSLPDFIFLAEDVANKVDFIFYLDFGFDDIEFHPVLFSKSDEYLNLFLCGVNFKNCCKPFDINDFFPSLAKWPELENEWKRWSGCK